MKEKKMTVIHIDNISKEQGLTIIKNLEKKKRFIDKDSHFYGRICDREQKGQTLKALQRLRLTDKSD